MSLVPGLGLAGGGHVLAEMADVLRAADPSGALCGPGNHQANILSEIADVFDALAGANKEDKCCKKEEAKKDECGEKEKEEQTSSCGCSSPENTVDGEFSIVGDPHVKGDLTLNGEDVNFNYTTEGGNGSSINMLDTDMLDIEQDFDTLHRKDGNTYAVDETVTITGENGQTTEINIDADTDEITVNGQEIFKCGDGTYCANGNKITKCGDKITIETADGQKITVTDKGDYLNTTVKLNDMETDQLGGMVGDSIKGNTNDNAEDYAVDSDSDAGQQDMEPNAAADLLESIGKFLMKSNEDLGKFLTSLANFIRQSAAAESSKAA